jgi:hypothetical protein
MGSQIIALECPNCGSSQDVGIEQLHFGCTFVCKHCSTRSVLIVNRRLYVARPGEHICSGCGLVARRSARFCQCGKSLLRYCWLCPKEFPVDHHVCDHCGTPQDVRGSEEEIAKQWFKHGEKPNLRYEAITRLLRMNESGTLPTKLDGGLIGLAASDILFDGNRRPGDHGMGWKILKERYWTKEGAALQPVVGRMLQSMDTWWKFAEFLPRVGLRAIIAETANPVWFRLAMDNIANRGTHLHDADLIPQAIKFAREKDESVSRTGIDFLEAMGPSAVPILKQLTPWPWSGTDLMRRRVRNAIERAAAAPAPRSD